METARRFGARGAQLCLGGRGLPDQAVTGVLFRCPDLESAVQRAAIVMDGDMLSSSELWGA